MTKQYMKSAVFISILDHYLTKKYLSTHRVCNCDYVVRALPFAYFSIVVLLKELFKRLFLFSTLNYFYCVV